MQISLWVWYRCSDQKWRHWHYISHYTNDHLICFQLSCFPIPIPHNFVINDLTLSFLGYQLTFVDGGFTILPIVICASPPLFLLSDVPRVRSCECERIHEVVIPFLSPPVILPTHKVITSSPPLTRSTRRQIYVQLIVYFAPNEVGSNLNIYFLNECV